MIAPAVASAALSRSGAARIWAPAFGLLLAGIACSYMWTPSAGALPSLQLVANYLLVALNAAYVYLTLSASADTGNPARFANVDVALGMAGLGLLLGVVVSPVSADSEIRWKFGLGVAVSYLFFSVVASRLENKGLRLFAGLALAGLHLAMGSRGLAMVTAVVVVSTLSSSPYTQRSRVKITAHGAAQNWRGATGRPRSIALIALSGLVAIQLVGLLAGAGTLGSTAEEKFQAQNGNFGLLLGARKDTLFLVVGIAHHAIFGLGAGALGDTGLRAETADWLMNNGYQLTTGDLARLVLSPGYALHSVALAALLQVGVLAIPMVVMATYCLLMGLRTSAHVSGSSMFLILAGLTHLFFSPLGDSTRLPLGLAFGVSMLLVRYNQWQRVDAAT